METIVKKWVVPGIAEVCITENGDLFARPDDEFLDKEKVNGWVKAEVMPC